MLDDLVRRCHAIEEAYEFMLAYAAQGLPGDAGSSSGGELRGFLSRASAAIAGIDDLFRQVVRQRPAEPQDRYLAFGDVLGRDAVSARAAIELVLAQPSISSQLIDNLNASMHLRSLLTDLFLIDEVLRPLRISR